MADGLLEPEEQKKLYGTNCVIGTYILRFVKKAVFFFSPYCFLLGIIKVLTSSFIQVNADGFMIIVG